MPPALFFQQMQPCCPHSRPKQCSYAARIIVPWRCSHAARTLVNSEAMSTALSEEASMQLCGPHISNRRMQPSGPHNAKAKEVYSDTFAMGSSAS